MEPYVKAARDVAASERVPLIDLYAYSTRGFNELAPEGIQSFVPTNLGGHLNREGAERVAVEVARALCAIDARLKLKSR